MSYYSKYCIGFFFFTHSRTHTVVAITEMDVPRSAVNGQMFGMRNHPIVIIVVALSSIVVVVHFLALLISTCILPFVESSREELLLLEREEARIGSSEDMTDIHGNATTRTDMIFMLDSRRSAIDRSEKLMRKYVQLSWLLSTGVGIVLFAVNLPFIAFYKFYSHSYIAAYVAIAVLTPAALIITAFALRFYRDLMSNKTDLLASDVEHINIMRGRMAGGEESDDDQLDFDDELKPISRLRSVSQFSLDHLVVAVHYDETSKHDDDGDEDGDDDSQDDQRSSDYRPW